MGWVRIFAGPPELQDGQVAFLQPSAQDFARWEWAHEHGGLRTKRTRSLRIAQDAVVRGNQIGFAGEVAAEGAGPIGEDGPAR